LKRIIETARDPSHKSQFQAAKALLDLETVSGENSRASQEMVTQGNSIIKRKTIIKRANDDFERMFQPKEAS
jgi:hypothetical protein